MLIGQMDVLHIIAMPRAVPAWGSVVFIHKNGMIESYIAPPDMGPTLEEAFKKNKHKFVQDIRRGCEKAEYGGFTAYDIPYVMIVNL